MHGAANIITGVCQTDFAGYYDCRQDFISSQEATINQALLGSPEGFKIHTPLMNLTKKESVELLVNLKQTKKEALEAISYSHTCYSGTFLLAALAMLATQELEVLVKLVLKIRSSSVQSKSHNYVKALI